MARNLSNEMDRGLLGTMLYDRRRDLGVSQNVAAVQIGTNPQSYSEWERGTNRPQQLKWVMPLAEWLDAPMRRVLHAMGMLDDEEYGLLSEALGGYLEGVA